MALNYDEVKKKNIQHKTVNQSLNFVDKKSYACTNLIESFWCQVKAMFKENERL